MKIKIINILTHQPNKIIFQYKDPILFSKRFPLMEYIKIDNYPYWIGFFKLDWHHKFGKYILEQSTEYEIECWRPYGNTITKIYEKKVDNITHKVFPSFINKIPKIGIIEKSPLMIKNLKDEIKRKNIIIHIYGSHHPLTTWLLNTLKPYNVPVILQHLGGYFSYFEFKYLKNFFKLLPYNYEKKSLQYVDLYLTASKIEEEFLKQKFPKLNKEFFYNGIDLSEFPLISQKEARKKLKIPENSKVILYVGRFSPIKGLNILLKAFEIIQKKNNSDNIKLLLVGGYKDDPLYEKALKIGSYIKLRDEKPINIFFSAADIYVMPIINRFHQDFAGFGIAPMESLAQNTPVISPNLIHFQNKDIINKLGIFLKDVTIDNLANAIENLLFSNIVYETRSIIENYLNIYTNTNKLIEKYEKLCKKYY